jgi:hypothetical protein
MGWFTRDEEKVQDDRSAELAKQLAAHEATRGDMDAAYAKADARCREVGQQYVAAKVSGAADKRELREALQQLKNARDDIRRQWQAKATPIERELEGITAEPIRVFIQWCLDEVRRLPKDERQISKEVTGYGEKSGKPFVMIGTNLAAIKQVQDILVNEGIHKVRQLSHGSLADIAAFTLKVRKAAANVNLNDMVAAEVPGELAADVTAPPEAQHLTSAWRLPDGGVTGAGVHDQKFEDKKMWQHYEQLKQQAVKGGV